MESSERRLSSSVCIYKRLSLISNVSFFCSFMILYSQGLSIGIKLTGLLLSKWVER